MVRGVYSVTTSSCKPLRGFCLSTLSYRDSKFTVPPISHRASVAQGAARAEPTVASSDWVEPNPTEPAVPVTLPSTAMTNAPAPAPPGT